MDKMSNMKSQQNNTNSALPPLPSLYSIKVLEASTASSLQRKADDILLSMPPLKKIKLDVQQLSSSVSQVIKDTGNTEEVTSTLANSEPVVAIQYHWFNKTWVVGTPIPHWFHGYHEQFWSEEVIEARRDNAHSLRFGLPRDLADLKKIKSSIGEGESKYADCVITLHHYCVEKYSEQNDVLDGMQEFLVEMTAKSGYNEIEKAFVLGGMLCSCFCHFMSETSLQQRLQQHSVPFSVREATQYMEIYRNCAAFQKLLNSSLSIADFTLYLGGAVRSICHQSTSWTDYKIY